MVELGSLPWVGIVVKGVNDGVSDSSFEEWMQRIDIWIRINKYRAWRAVVKQAAKVEIGLAH